MKATELLERQHRMVEKLFAQMEDVRGEQGKRDIFEKLAINLVAHDAIEREIFYPACEREVRGASGSIRQSVVEHGLMAICVARADRNKNGELDPYVKVLKDVVAHHIEEEEDGLLPMVAKKLSKARNEALGAEMETRFQRAMREDFRLALRNTLEQVLGGRARMAPPKRSIAKARATSTTRARPKSARKRTTVRRGTR